MLAGLALLLLPSVYAYNWKFNSQPTQCSSVTVQVAGGTPPYRILVVPFGPTPLESNHEVRVIIDQSFNGNDHTLDLDLKYPANSQFVAVMSDATGFGSGGTTVATQVQSSDDASCFDDSQSVSPLFTFSITPPNQIVQCQETRIFWNPGEPQGDTTFLGVIPGGNSFIVPKGEITNRQAEGEGEGFSWTPSVRGGTTLLLIGGDDRGNGTAGSTLNTVSSGTTSDNTGCLNNDSPSSTPGNPAGQVATATGTSFPENDDSGSTNIGAIIGGVIGGVVLIIALVLVLLFYRRQQGLQKKQKEAVDLLNADELGDESPSNNDGGLPQYYEPEPFIVPDPTVASTSIDGRTSADWRNSQVLSSTTSARSPTPDLLSAHGHMASSTTGPRKSPIRQLRPVNIIQHDDAGPSEAPPAGEPETIELPPAYTNIRPLVPAGEPHPPQASASTPSPAVDGTRS